MQIYKAQRNAILCVAACFLYWYVTLIYQPNLHKTSVGNYTHDLYNNSPMNVVAGLSTAFANFTMRFRGWRKQKRDTRMSKLLICAHLLNLVQMNVSTYSKLCIETRHYLLELCHKFHVLVCWCIGVLSRTVFSCSSEAAAACYNGSQSMNIFHPKVYLMLFYNCCTAAFFFSFY